MPFASKQAKREYQQRYMQRWRQSGTLASERYHDAEQRRNTARHGKTRKQPLFLAIDGEMSNRVGGSKRVYNVIQFYMDPGPHETGNAELWSLQDPLGVGIIAFAQRLRSLVSMLRQRYPHRSVTPVWFAGQFDADQMIGCERSLTLEQKAAIVETHGSRFGSVRMAGFVDSADMGSCAIRIRWGRKSLQFDYPVGVGTTDWTSSTRSDQSKGHEKKYYRITVTDVWSITAKSFVKTIESICIPHWTPEQRAEYLPLLDLIEQGKESRQYADWLGWNSEKIERYNRAELILLGNYCDVLWSFCGRVGIYPRSFAGPAPFARALQRAYGITSHIKPEQYDEIDYQEGVAFRHELDSYYGGRIETVGQGWVGRLYEYDIRSAYPDAERRAPCLAHGHWRILSDAEIQRANETATIPDSFGTYECQWWWKPVGTVGTVQSETAGPKTPRWGPLPVRDVTGRVCFPLAGRGWYKGIELQALMDCYPGSWCLFAGQVWESTCHLEHPRKEMIEETYNKRAELKQVGDGAEVVLKLALNSGYGVTAQTAGAYREINEQGETTGYHTPKTSNITLASWDTAYVRARIYRALVSSPQTVAAATDAVYSLAAVPGCIDDNATGELGSWEAKEHTMPVLIVAPGLSVTHEGMLKKRGIGGKVNGKALIEAWDRTPEDSDFTFAVSQQRYKDLRASLHCHNGVWTLDSDWGEFLSLERELNLTPSILASKRNTAHEFMTHPPHDFTVYPPYAGGQYTVGYRRPFDVDAPDTQLSDELHAETDSNQYAL